MKNIMKLIHNDDEVELFINDNYIVSANHDEHGYNGMFLLESAVENIAKELKIELIIE